MRKRRSSSSWSTTASGGWGEVVPSALYGQSLEVSEAALDAMASLLGDDPFAIESTVGRILAAHDDQRAAVAGVDSALHDWVGRRLGIPVWRLLGLDQPRKQTTFTIGVADLAETREKVEEARAARLRRAQGEGGDRAR